MSRVSVILATCEQPTLLRYALLGYARQTFRDFELIVADDGSGPETRGLIDHLRPQLPFSLAHVWQEHQGFRKSRIVNEAVLHSRGDLLILSDGDSIPSADFVKLHVEECPPAGFSVGGYVGLGQEATLALSDSAVRNGDYETALTWTHRWKDRLEHLWNFLSVQVGKRGRPRVRGCNITVAREAFFKINGFDENFDGFGKEDSDLRDRLMISGARPRSLWGRSFVFHLYPAFDEELIRRRKPRTKNPDYYWRTHVPPRAENGLARNGEALDLFPALCPRCETELRPAGASPR